MNSWFEKEKEIKRKREMRNKTSLCVERDGCSAGSHKFVPSAHLTNLYLACK